MSNHFLQFRHLAIERAKPAPTEAQIAAIEELLGARLPASFREFLDVANGGYIEYVIDVELDGGKSEELGFCGIFSADPGEHCDETFVGEIRSFRETMKIPSGVLPFARTGGASVAFLDLTPDGGGRVAAFVEGLPAWTGLRTKSQFVELASTFDEYVERLRIDRGAVIDQLTNDATTLEHVDATEEWLDIGLPSWRDDVNIAAAVRSARERIGR